ncbi:unnamed protein product [Colias eurytheme]|nr:unnamed protein product [Colias eurytheme]
MPIGFSELYRVCLLECAASQSGRGTGGRRQVHGRCNEQWCCCRPDGLIKRASCKNVIRALAELALASGACAYVTHLFTNRAARPSPAETSLIVNLHRVITYVATPPRPACRPHAPAPWRPGAPDDCDKRYRTCGTRHRVGWQRAPHVSAGSGPSACREGPSDRDADIHYSIIHDIISQCYVLTDILNCLLICDDDDDLRRYPD